MTLNLIKHSCSFIKQYTSSSNPQDREIQQSDLNNITNWCQDWRMDLNKSKCGVLQFTRCLQPTINQYTLVDIPVKPLTCVKDLGVSITKDMKWNQHVQDLSSKANKMLGFVKRTASGIHDKRVRKILYLTIVRSQLAYSSQVWAPQTVNKHQNLFSRSRTKHLSCIRNDWLPSESSLYVTGMSI